MDKVKKLPSFLARELQEVSKARRLANLPPLRPTVRSCLACRKRFESLGNRFCGCTSRSSVSYAGREIL
jgi:hypothetical protein